MSPSSINGEPVTNVNANASNSNSKKSTKEYFKENMLEIIAITAIIVSLTFIFLIGITIFLIHNSSANNLVDKIFDHSKFILSNKNITPNGLKNETQTYSDSLYKNIASVFIFESNKELVSFIALLIVLLFVILYSLRKLSKIYELNDKRKETKIIADLALSEYKDTDIKKEIAKKLEQFLNESGDITISNAMEIINNNKLDKHLERISDKKKIDEYQCYH
jgi:hypothetical protein